MAWGSSCAVGRLESGQCAAAPQADKYAERNRGVSLLETMPRRRPTLPGFAVDVVPALQLAIGLALEVAALVQPAGGACGIATRAWSASSTERERTSRPSHLVPGSKVSAAGRVDACQVASR
jgi:hypothetical protein